MTDEKCRTDCPCYVQDGTCDDDEGTIILGPQFYEDCLLRDSKERCRLEDIRCFYFLLGRCEKGHTLPEKDQSCIDYKVSG